MKNTFDFLVQLAENNNKQWFADYKNEFDELNKKSKVFFTSIFDELNKTDDIEEMKMFRIYRDVRFSKDKTPYKTHFSCAFVRKKPQLRGGYYLHLQPNESFIGGGFWDPNPEDLLRIRKEFEYDAQSINKIINEEQFIKTFGSLQGEELKSAPKGFDKNHKNIHLIKKKQFLVMKKYINEEVFADDFQSKVVKDFQVMRPFFDYMSDVLTTDSNGVSIL